MTEDSTTVQTSSLPSQTQGSDEFVEYDIDLSSHGYNNIVAFQVSYVQSNLLSYFIIQDNLLQIQAVSSCGKLSEIFPVNGTCISPMKPHTTEKPPASTIGIIVGSIIAAILLIFSLVFFAKYR